MCWVCSWVARASLMATETAVESRLARASLSAIFPILFPPNLRGFFGLRYHWLRPSPQIMVCGLRFINHAIAIYISYSWFIIRTLAIYKSHICYLQSKLLRFISRTFAQKMEMQFINRKVTLLAIYKSQSYVAAIYKSQSHVPWDL